MQKTGREALKILRSHYMSAEKPRVIASYTELISLVKGCDEDLTNFILQAETVKALLVKAGETISDSLLMAMLFKGLPSDFKTFVTMAINQTPETFTHFKRSLRVYEGTMKMYEQGGAEDSIMSVQKKSGVKCFGCGQIGHMRRDCQKKYGSDSAKSKKKWCEFCRTATHNTDVYRRNQRMIVRQNCVQTVRQGCLLGMKSTHTRSRSLWVMTTTTTRQRAIG